MKKIFILLFVLSSLFVSTHAQTLKKQATMTITDINAKTYKIKGTEGGLDIEGLEGKIVILEFFGHRCPPCIASIPHLIRLQENHKDKLVIISMEVQGLSGKRLTGFVKAKNINYIVTSNENSNAFIEYISQRADWRGGIPFMIALDTKGIVQYAQAGMVPEATLEKLIEQLTPKKSAVMTDKSISEK